jgi:diguanylate cyclase (GGDEF)-like protein/PAS domain S-box-containing protein
MYMTDDSEFYKNLLENLYDGIYFVDDKRVITFWNKASERITGFSREQVLGHSCKDHVLNHCTEAGVELCLDGCPLTATLADGCAREADVFLHHADGHRVPVRVRASPIHDANGKITGAVETFSDNTEVFSARRRILRLEETSTTDPLTKVGNRLAADLHLKTALIEFGVTHNPFGLLFIDIDNFKTINDTYGHEMGDRVLHVVANTLRINLRQTDWIGRWGGEEFIILVDIQNEALLEKIAVKARNLIDRSQIQTGDTAVGVTASIGATLARGADTPESLVARADQLMYRSKQSGRNRVTLG